MSEYTPLQRKILHEYLVKHGVARKESPISLDDIETSQSPRPFSKRNRKICSQIIRAQGDVLKRRDELKNLKY